MEQRGARGAAALRKTTSAVAGRDFGYELLHCGDAYARSNRPDIYPDSTERSSYDDQDITTGRRRRARGLRSYENTVDETDG